MEYNDIYTSIINKHMSEISEAADILIGISTRMLNEIIADESKTEEYRITDLKSKINGALTVTIGIILANK